jgi:phage terminase small subunit
MSTNKSSSGLKAKEKGKGKGKKLTLKQAKFTKEYLKSGNGTQAAIKAGYSKKTAKEIASENLTKPNIKQTIQSAADKLGINAEYVLNGFKEIKEFNSKKQKKFITIGDNTFEEEKMIDAQAALRANELLGKHLKLFTDKIEVDAKIEEKTDEDVKKQIAKKLFLALQNPDILNNFDDL